MRFEDTHHVPEHFYRNHLPHFDPKDAPYFVTYRLHNSIPKSELEKLVAKRAASRSLPLHKHEGVRAPSDRVGVSSSSPNDRVRASSSLPDPDFLAFDHLLDQNGPYHLQRPDIRQIVAESLAHLDKNEIHLYAYCLMPNHVHAVFDLRTQRELYAVMQSHKSFTARRANEILRATGEPFWEQETYDRVVREGQLGNTIWYTLLNPVKAGFVKRWQDWPGTYLSPDCHGFD